MTTPTQQLIEDFQARHQAISLEAKELPFRNHLGLSGIGEACARKVWYGFRWSVRRDFPPNIVRLFDRGHKEEPRFVGYLRSVGVTVQEVHPETGKQFKASRLGGHVGGSVDGFARGFIEYPGEWVLLEMKTHSYKSFEDLTKKGVKISKPTHYAQVQVYMRSFKLTKCFYMAVNKNNDELYTEWVFLDEAVADQYLELADSLVTGPIPERNALSSTHYMCRMCDYRPICWHRSGAEPDENCRTCTHSVPNTTTGVWDCAYSGATDIDCYNPCEAYDKRAEFVKPQDIIISLG